MSNELKERIEELEELLEESQELIIELQEEVEHLSIDLQGSISQDDLYEQKEVIMSTAFDAGYMAGDRGDAQMKSWLNYKIEARV
jgi:hypothetical protein